MELAAALKDILDALTLIAMLVAGAIVAPFLELDHKLFGYPDGILASR